MLSHLVLLAKTFLLREIEKDLLVNNPACFLKQLELFVK